MIFRAIEIINLQEYGTLLEYKFHVILSNPIKGDRSIAHRFIPAIHTYSIHPYSFQQYIPHSTYPFVVLILAIHTPLHPFVLIPAIHTPLHPTVFIPVSSYLFQFHHIQSNLTLIAPPPHTRCRRNSCHPQYSFYDSF